ncbi:hypothetical protein COCSUDRAFT_42808 [Coccomyxa subellipsoidea C-169]|uniref:RRM domain-containing protein n=1 Tax=Coccomyxa subellipsoidea (strain C-169) TaxID=574566 RepID=I0YTM7_COCSC|nr:hypothetical protein COCSUDRAFT_42808 [Coccomyxa subellipsoidea C-169]EIE21746.1 hypothetical protein COCSUDRAFT_42808 [Coccomyxa subellipsoidea C-169]|eukprot:XP_005646290.1 hypothetical protein COCSUDRAFT_42808 [Coccomyxa subellipsoidea C-169]
MSFLQNQDSNTDFIQLRAMAAPRSDLNAPGGSSSEGQIRASAKYLFVNNVADCADEILVHAAFEKYNLMDVYLPRSHETGKIKKFGFLAFASEEDGLQALEEMDGSTALNPSHPIRLSINTSPKVDADKMIDLDIRRLYMGNLQSAISEDAIYSAFKRYNLQNIRLVTDRETGLPRGFGFLTFGTAQEAKRALTEMNQRPFPGTSWSIKLGVDKDPVPPPPQMPMRSASSASSHHADRSESPGMRTQQVVSRLQDSYTIVSGAPDKNKGEVKKEVKKEPASRQPTPLGSSKSQGTKGPGKGAVKAPVGRKELSAADSNPFACLAPDSV